MIVNLLIFLLLASDVDCLLDYIMQIKQINSPTTLRSMAEVRIFCFLQGQVIIYNVLAGVFCTWIKYLLTSFAWSIRESGKSFIQSTFTTRDNYTVAIEI